jgi:hypothetical protein
MFSWRGRYSPDMDGELNHQMLGPFTPVGDRGSWNDEQFLLPCCPRNLRLCRLTQEQEVTRNRIRKAVILLDKIVTVGDVAVTSDPIHAALAWAAFRTIVKVSSFALQIVC